MFGLRRMKRPLHFITREHELELIQRLLTIVDDRNFHPNTTAVVMASPDYSATVAMHLAHAWSRDGDMLSLIPVHVAYPDEDPEDCRRRMELQIQDFRIYDHLVLVEAGIIRGSNWRWMLEVLTDVMGFRRDQITTVALCENLHSAVKSDYVAEYYDNNTHELMFYYERFNRHWTR